ncbi:Potassium channel subfamily K member 6 [Halotydeus destructor]|nr:Potassium channel subfamily K member 6 [Halotydeus destructor]
MIMANVGPSSGPQMDKKCSSCDCGHMSSYSSGYSVMIEDSDLAVTREEYRYENSLDSEDDDDCVYCTTSHPNVNLFLFLVAYVGFLVFGACMFNFIENPVQLQMREQLVRRQQAFLLQHPSVDVESLNSLIEFITNLEAKGVHWEPLPVPPEVAHSGPTVYGAAQGQERPGPASLSPLAQPLVANSNKTANADTWEFTSSLLFVTSIVTTVGYGHVTPQTHVGKISTMLYSAVGIPLTLTFLSTMVALLVRGPARGLEKLLANCLLKICRSASIFFIRFMHLIIVTTILLCLCFFIPAYAFYHFEEGWTYLDSLYYCYISLTTIGLGDYVPSMGSQAVQSTYRLVTIGYLYFGLTMIMLWLALVYRIPQFNLNKLLISEEKKMSPSVTYGSFSKKNSNEKQGILSNHSVSSQSTQNTPLPSKSYGARDEFLYTP